MHQHVVAQNNRSWFNRHLLISKLALACISALLTLVAGEFALRLLGKETGYVPRYKRFRPVDRLEVYDSFATDSEGVFKANPNYNWSEHIQINSDGFRGAEFNPHPKNGQPKILFLGDSFAWGSSARPLTNCFVDIISRSGFVTFNTGIPGTGPTQYAYLAEKYVPLLKPDFVAVMFYMGNDLRRRSRPMLPYKSLFHDTNAKMLYAFNKDGNYMTPQQAYEYYLSKSNAVTTDTTLKSSLRKIFMRSVVGTYAWVALAKLRKHFTTGSSPNHESMKLKYDFTKRALARIKRICKKNGAQFMLFVIPVHPEKVSIYTSIDYNLEILEAFDPYIPDFLDRGDYMKLPNAHFNNSGHRKYAEYILKTIHELQREGPKELSTW
ncbi:MAG: hypothetical protein ACE5IR_11485 [bacterium]